VDVAALVRRLRDPLLAVAFLLDGDERTAEDRVDRTLARLSPTADHGTAVRALLRTRPPRGTLADDGEPPWWVAPADLAAARRTAAALAGLDPQARTALVLDHDGLPADPGALARARAAAPGADLDGLLAARRPPQRDEDAAVARVRGLRRTRRTRPLVAVVAVAAVAVLVGLAALVPAAAPARPDRFDVPTRGSMAGDAALLDALRDTGWDAAPPVDRRRVVYAGDLLDRRWVLVAGRTGAGWVGVWSSGPAGSTDLAPVNRPVALPADRPAVLQLDDALLVVADPGEQVQVSTGQVVRPDATVGRDFVAVPATDGVAAVPLAAPDPGGVAVRVQVGTGTDVPVTVAGTADARATAPALVPLRAAGPDHGSRQAAVDDALAAVAVPTGLDPGALVPVLLWAGQLGAPVGDPVDAVVLAVPLPGGAVVVTTAWAGRRSDGTLRAVGCGSRALPAGTDPAALTSAARCVVADRDTGTARVGVVVTGPAGSAVVPDDARTLAVVDGVPVTATGPADLFAG